MPGHNWYQSNFWMPDIYWVFRNYIYLILACFQSGLKQFPLLTPFSPWWLVADVYFEFSCMVSVLSTAAHMASQSHQENIECLTWQDCKLSLTSAKLPVVFREIGSHQDDENLSDIDHFSLFLHFQVKPLVITMTCFLDVSYPVSNNVMDRHQADKFVWLILVHKQGLNIHSAILRYARFFQYYKSHDAFSWIVKKDRNRGVVCHLST